MSRRSIDSLSINKRQESKKTESSLSDNNISGGIKSHKLDSFPRKTSLRTYGYELRARIMTVFCSVAIIVFGITFLTNAGVSPIATTIGENIATNNLSLAGAVTAGSWLGDIIDTAHGGTGLDLSAIVKGSIPFFSGTGALSTLNPGVSGQVLISNGSGENPSWGTVTRSATFVVAASDSAASSKKQADYVCDGTDDQVEIQAAIDAANTRGGGKVLLLSGNYILSAFLSVKNNVVLEGEDHMGTKVNTPTTGLAYIIRCFSDSTVRNIKAIGEGKNSGGTQMGIVAITGSTNVKIIDNEVTEIPNDAIMLGGSYGQASGNYVHDIHEGIEFGSDSTVLNNRVENSVQECIEIISNAQNILVSGNILKNAGENAITLYGSGNFNDITISDNKIINPTLSSIKDISAGSTIRRIKFVNNLINGGSSVIMLGYGNVVYDSEIARNVISSSASYGIQVNSNIVSSIISNNTIVTTGYYGIILANASENQIKGNIIRGSTMNLKITNVAGINNVINDNYLSGTYKIDVPVTNKISNNIGYLNTNSGTSTITAGQTSVTVTHGLAATPTRVQLTPTTATGGKDYYISAKTATTFTITIDSAHTSDISFDWRATVGEGN